LRVVSKLRDAETEEERERIKAGEYKASNYHEATTVDMYNERYTRRVLAVYDVLEQRGWFGPNDRRYFEHPMSDYEIGTVAERLKRVGLRL
jgi:hypothetical protein